MPYIVPLTKVDGRPVGASEWNLLVNDTRHLASDMPRCTATTTVDVSIANNDLTPVPWDTNVEDTAAIHPLGGDLTRFTAPYDGLWRFAYSLSPDRGPGITYNCLSVARIGGLVESCRQSTLAALTLDNGLTATVQVRMQAGQYIQCLYSQNAGSAVLLKKAGAYATFRWVGTY